MSESVLLAVIGGVFGAVIGSFLNVCIVRLPAEQSVVSPPSRCPRCGRPVGWSDNIPVISWLLLRGKCRGCREPISILYPLVELSVALLWAAMAWHYGLNLEALKGALFGTLLIGIAFTDAREYIIPNEFTFGGIAIGLAICLFPGGGVLSEAVFGAAFGTGLVFFVGFIGRFVARKEAMGGGDVAMVGLVGCFLGWQSVLLTMFLGSVVGLLIEVLRLVVVRSTAPGPDSEPPEASRSWGDKVLVAALPISLLLNVFLSAGNGLELAGASLGGMFFGLGTAYLLLGILEFIRFSRTIGEGASAIIFTIAGVLGILMQATPLILPARLAIISTVVLCGYMVAGIPRNIRRQHEEPFSKSMDQLSTQELRRMKYLPFGVSLAIAAALTAVFLDPAKIASWIFR